MRWLFLVALALLTCLGACGGLAPSPGRAEAHDERDEEAVEERAEADSVVDTAVVDGEQVADADGDRIVDAADACPQEAEAYNGSDDEDGCPDCANHIILTEAWGPPVIRFADDGTEAIFPSDLDFMAAVVVAHTEYARVEVAGSARRGERDPAALSAARAEAVVAALVARGVAPERLTASSHGASDEGATARFIVTREGSGYPLCNTPFPGCEPSALSLYILERISFPRSSAAIEDGQGLVLDAVGATLSGNPQIDRLEVLGHAARGERPRALALARANAVIEALVARGVARERLVPVDAGSAPGDEGRLVRFGPVTSAGCRGIPAPPEE